MVTLALLANDRDSSLGAIFDVRDDIRESHPELQIQGDGPYQVMGIDYHMNHNVMVFDDFSVYAPWPGYVVVGAPYGGWAYGRVYQPGIFFNLYLGWHSNYVSIGAPVFFGGFYGHAGYVPFRGGAFVGGPRAYASYVQPGRTYFATTVHRDGFNRFNKAGHGAVPGSFGHQHGGSFNPSNRGASTPGWNRAGSGSNPSGFNRTGIRMAVECRTEPAVSRAATPARPGGSFNRSPSGGYSHGNPGTRSSGTGSFQQNLRRQPR